MYYPKRKRVKEGPPAFEYFRKKSDAKAVAIIFVASAIASSLLSLRALQKRRREGVVNNARHNFNTCEGDSTGQKVIIIGGGASGSALAAELTQRHPELYVTVIEHQTRRVFTGCIPLAQVGIRSYDIMRIGVWDSLRSPATWNITREADLVMGKVQKIDAQQKKVYVLPNQPELGTLKTDKVGVKPLKSELEEEWENQREHAQHSSRRENYAITNVNKYNSSANINTVNKKLGNRYTNESRRLGFSTGDDDDDDNNNEHKYHSQPYDERESQELPTWKRVQGFINTTTSFISSNLPFLTKAAMESQINSTEDLNNSYTITRDGLHVYPYDVLVIAAGAERTLGALSSLLKYSDLDRNRVVVNPGPTRDTIVHAFASNIVYAKVPPLSFVAQMEALRHGTRKLPSHLSTQHKESGVHYYNSLIKCVKSLLFDVNTKVEFDDKDTNSFRTAEKSAHIAGVQIDGVLDEHAELTIGNKSDMALRAIANALECHNLQESHEQKKEQEIQIRYLNTNPVDISDENTISHNDDTSNSVRSSNYCKEEHEKHTRECGSAFECNNLVAYMSVIDKYIARLMHFTSRQFDGTFVSAVNLLWHFIDDHKRFAFTRLLCVSAESQPLSMGVSEPVNDVINSYWNELVDLSRRGSGSSLEREHTHPHFHFLSHSYITAVDTAQYTATLYNYLYDMYMVVPYNTLILDLPLRAPSFVRKSNLHRANYVKEHVLQNTYNSVQYNNTWENVGSARRTIGTVNSSLDRFCLNTNNDKQAKEWLHQQRLKLRRFMSYLYYDGEDESNSIHKLHELTQEREKQRFREYKLIFEKSQSNKESKHVCNALHCPERLEEMFADEMSFVDVDPQTLQHRQYDNIFAIGDVAGLPTLKSYSSAQAQVPVVAHNVYQVLQRIREDHRCSNNNENTNTTKYKRKSKDPLAFTTYSQKEQLTKKDDNINKTNNKLQFFDEKVSAFNAEGFHKARHGYSLSRRLLNANKNFYPESYLYNNINANLESGTKFTNNMTSTLVTGAATITNTVDSTNTKGATLECSRKVSLQENCEEEETSEELLISSKESKKVNVLSEEEEEYEYEREKNESEKSNARVYDGYTSFMINMSMKQSMWPEFCYSDAQRAQFRNDRHVRLRSCLQNMNAKTGKMYNATIPIISTANDINELLYSNCESTMQVSSNCDSFVLDSTSPLPSRNYHMWDNLKWQDMRGRANSFVQDWFLYELMHFFCFTRSLWHPQYWLRQPQYNDDTDGEIIPPQSSFIASPLKYLHELL